MPDLPLPNGIELTPLDESFRDNPYDVLARIRADAPVFEDQDLHRFIYTRHDDVKSILRDAELWSDPRKGNPGTFTRDFLGDNIPEDGLPSMLLMDEPDHRRLRTLVSASFTPAAVARWKERTRAVVAEVLDQITDDEFDLIDVFAGPVPTIVIAEMLGIDPEHREAFKEWSDTVVAATFNPFASDEAKAAERSANASLEAFFMGEIESRRDNLGVDLISDMIRAEEDGERLTANEMVTQCNLLLIAGNVTTTDLIGNGVKALLEHREQWDKLKADHSLIGNAVEEMLRYDSPVINSGRIASKTVNYQGCPVHQGETLSVSLAAANHDPEVYPDPTRFDIERVDTHHQSFGGGRHLCLGAHLARLEAAEAILGLISRYPDLQLSDKGAVHHAIPGFRGMSSFWVKA